MSTPKLHLQLLLTGDEIMSGDTLDSNSSMIAHHLGPLGIGIQRKVTLGDNHAQLVNELRAMTQQADVVIINGGLGPTVDDLTAQVVADVAAVPLADHPQAIEHLQQWCARRNVPLNKANLKQAVLPQGCNIIANPIGSAVGFEMAVAQCRVICTPGVPGELRAMLGGICQSIAGDRSGTSRVLRLQTFGLGESIAQQWVDDNIPDWPEQLELGFRASAPQMEIKLTAHSLEAQALQAEYAQRLKDLFGQHIIGSGDTTLAGEVLRLLTEQQATVSTAESCTGGLIASQLTAVSGASKAFHAGFVTYHNDIKHRILQVQQSTLQQKGAVSEAVVREMAEGALHQSEADYAIAVSGIAGPDGGSEDKPVGTAWIAWGDKNRIDTCCLYWPVARNLFQTMIGAAALDLLRRRLLGATEEPVYIRQRRRQ